MKLEDIGNWVESEQFKKILEILSQAPSIIKQLRNLGILKEKDNTAEELKDAFDKGDLEFKSVPSHDDQPQYDLLIKQGAEIIQNIPWSELAQEGVVSLATLGVSIHNAVMLHKISHQIKQLDIKVDKILRGQQQDREAKCTTALDLLHDALNLKREGPLDQSLAAAADGYNSIRSDFYNNLKEWEEWVAKGQSLFNTLKQEFIAQQFGIFYSQAKNYMQRREDEQQLAIYNDYLDKFQNQWHYLYLATYVRTIIYMLYGKPEEFNKYINKFRTEIFERIEDANFIDKKIIRQCAKQLNALENLSIKKLS